MFFRNRLVSSAIEYLVSFAENENDTNKTDQSQDSSVSTSYPDLKPQPVKNLAKLHAEGDATPVVPYFKHTPYPFVFVRYPDLKRQGGYKDLTKLDVEGDLTPVAPYVKRSP